MLLSVVWVSRSPDWEPLIAFLTLFFTYIYQDYKGYNYATQKERICEHDKALFLQYEELLPEFCTHTALEVHAREIFEMDQIYRARPQAAVSTDEESNMK